MLDSEFTNLFFNIILSQTLNIVITTLSKYILGNMTELVKDKLSDYDFVNKFIGNKKNYKVIKAYYDINTHQSMIPSLYLKIADYLKKKNIYKDFKFNGKQIKSIIEDKEIVVNSVINIRVKNTLHNEKDIESVIEIYTLVNNFDINKFYSKL